MQTFLKKLQRVYQDLYEKAKEKNQVTGSIFKQPQFKHLHEILNSDFTNIAEASLKFSVFVNIDFLQELLDIRWPVAFEAKVKFEEISTPKAAEKVAFAVVRIPHHGTDCTFSTGQQILLVSNGFNLTLKIVKIDKAKKFIILSAYFYKNLEKYRNLCNNKFFHIFILPNDKMLNTVLNAISVINNNAVKFEDKLFPKSTPNNRAINQYNTRMNKWIHRACLPELNVKQQEAVFGISQGSDSSTFVLFGPPGTGKTTTLVAAVGQIAKNPAFKNNHILVCAPSNLAADVFAEDLMKKQDFMPSEIFRFMPENRDASEVRSDLKCVTRTKKLPGGITVFAYPKGVQKFRVIISTLGSSSTLRQFVQPGHFSHIFVDEAGFATEMECWLALGNFATDKTRLILAGDPRLLGPVCTTQVLSGFGFKKSLLHRLISVENIENDPRQMIQLTDNYRSHPAIVEFISSNFYDDTLVAMNNTSCCTLPFLPNPGFPLMFHNVNGKQRKENNTWANIPEAKVVIDYVQKCINGGYKPEEIGVVSPYKYQGKIIRSRLKNSKVTVETVEKFQGSERKIIIITTTRIKRLGFVAEDLRFNTSVSRGKDLVILVGKEAALSKFPWFKNFIDACRNNSSATVGGGEDDIEISDEEDNDETSEGDDEDGTWEMLENLRIN